ncbi:MAG: DUF2878 domain-containing protein [bacterium]|nr:DUF2878 domain-containing protein [bacterium]
MGVFINFAAFQAGWFACILGAAHHRPWLGPLVVTAVLALHLASSKAPAAEALLAFSAGLVGFFVDSGLIALGAYAPVRHLTPAPWSTLWLVFLWVNFATTLNVSLAWLRGRFALQLLLGALGGPVAYYAGHGLKAIEMEEPLVVSLLSVALAWSIATPLLFQLARQLARLSGRR